MAREFPRVSGASRELKNKVAAEWRELLERKARGE
jgi:hypothetical protein